MADYNSAYTGVQIDANLALAESATQPGDLGTAAFTASTDYATAAQGTLAASAVQPGANATVLGSGSATDNFVLTANGSGGVAWEAAAGGGGTPGGATTQVQFNDGGAFNGDSGFTFDKTNKTLNVTGATITASDPIIDMAQTWNNAAVAFTALKVNVTNSASAVASLLMDLQKGGVSQFSVDNSGALVLASNTLEQRNGTSAQSFNLYNIYTNASNYERGFMRFVSNMLQIGAEKLGTGTARALAFQTDGTTRMTISADASSFAFAGSAFTSLALTGATFSEINARSGTINSFIGAGFAEAIVGSQSNHALSIKSNNVTRLKLDTSGSIEIANGRTVATLSAVPVVGMMARVTDATAPAVGSTVTGGGAAAALCWYNGANWTVIGV